MKPFRRSYFASLLLALALLSSLFSGNQAAAASSSASPAGGALSGAAKPDAGPSAPNPAAAITSFFQGFEVNNSGWNIGTADDAVRVASGTHGVTSRTGAYHAEVPYDNGGSAFTRWGGYSSVFPTGGFTTSVDIYLDPAAIPADDTRYDWDQAVTKSDGTFLRDFVFNAGGYTMADSVCPTVPCFVVSGSNNATRNGAYPKDPGHDPYAIHTTGWYTFQQHFYNNGGVLAGQLSILNAAGTVLHTWTRSNPSDVISIVGGNRYGWFANQEFPFLAIDNTRLDNYSDAPATVYVNAAWAGTEPGADPDGAGPATSFGYDSFATIQNGLDGVATGGTVNVAAGTYVEQLDVNKALTLHGAGQGSTIVQSPTTLVTQYTTTYPHKPVVFVHGGDAVIQNLTVDGAGRGNANNRMMGVDFHNAGGTLDHTTIVHVRNTPFDGVQAGVAVYALNDDNTPRTLTVDHNTLSDYQKNGMALSGAGLTANVTGNTVTGAGPTAIIAQNGIQISSGAVGFVSGNTVSGHSYTPFSAVSTGMLLFDADAQVLNNNLSENQVGIYHSDGQSTDSGNVISATGAGTGSAGFWGIIMDAPPPSRQPSPFDAAGGPLNKPAQPQSIQNSVATNNILNSDGSSGGIAIETDGGYGTPDIAFTANGNHINHWDDGIVVYQCPTGCTGSNFSSVLATRNTITNCNIAIWVDGGHITGGIRFNNNHLAGNNVYGIENTSAALIMDPATVDGSNNWWGATDGPGGAGPGHGDHVSANVTYSPFLAGQTYNHLAPSTPITISVGTTITLDLLTNALTQTVIAQQSYLTFTNSLLQNVDPNTGAPRSTVTHDLSNLTLDLQNQVCNGPGSCTFGSITAPAGSIAYASSVSPPNPGVTGDFRVAQVTFAATAVGDAVVHWQFSPPDPANRNSKITNAGNQVVSDPTLYQDYVIHIVHPQFTGHVTWEGRPAQPSSLQALPINLTLTLGNTDYNFNGLTTDANGNFTVDVNAVPNGTYTWRVKGPQYLSTSGSVTLNRAVVTAVEMGLQPAGDANNDNLVDISDFGILYASFGCQYPAGCFDARADFTGDQLVDITDFTLLRGNFGRLGNRPANNPQGKPAGGSAVLELRPQGKGPANGSTVHVGDRFVLELWVNAQPGTGVVAQQSYLSFPAQQLRLGAPPAANPVAGSTSLLTPDRSVLDLTLQNGMCNGPASCLANGMKIPAGSLAFASASLNATGSGAFRVGQVVVQATAPGTARLHWQFSPPDPANRNTKIAADGGATVSQPTQFVDYVLNVLPAGK